MTSWTTWSGNMECMEALTDFRTKPCSRRGRALGQACEGCQESFFVDTRLLFAKSVLGPKQDSLEIGIGQIGQSNAPLTAHRRHFRARLARGLASTLSATSRR